MGIPQGDDERIHALINTVERLSSDIDKLIRAENSQTQVVIHKQAGPGGLLAAAITACFASWIALILFAMEIHDLRAWRDIHQNHINALEAKQK